MRVNPAPLLPFVAVLLLVPFPASAQDELFSDFQFRELRFTFFPKGMENRQNSDGSGSAIAINVNEVGVEGESAVTMRECIDGDLANCSYEIPGGNDDGTVTVDEVESFQAFAQIGLRRAVPEVDELARMLQNNVTVDGLTGKNAVIVKVVLVGAEGASNSSNPIQVDLEAKVTYNNDPGLTRHAIRVQDLVLEPMGFEYESALWTAGDSGWRFDAAAVVPVAAQAKVTNDGYFSNQIVFEDFASQGLVLEITSEKASKKSPGPDVGLLVLFALFLGMVRRR